MDHQYFTAIAAIWRAYFNGRLTIGQRDKQLQAWRDWARAQS